VSICSRRTRPKEDVRRLAELPTLDLEKLLEDLAELDLGEAPALPDLV